MKPNQIVILAIIIVIILLVGVYFIVQAQPSKEIIISQPAVEPQANIWSLIGDLKDLFKKDKNKAKVPGNNMMGEDISGQMVNISGYLVDSMGGYYVDAQGNSVELPVIYTQLI